MLPDGQYTNIVDFGGGLDPNRLDATTLTNPRTGVGFIRQENVLTMQRALQQRMNSISEMERAGSTPIHCQSADLWVCVYVDFDERTTGRCKVLVE